MLMNQVAWGRAHVACGWEVEGRSETIKRSETIETDERLRELVQESKKEELVETTFPRPVVTLSGITTLLWARWVVFFFY